MGPMRANGVNDLAPPVAKSNRPIVVNDLQTPHQSPPHRSPSLPRTTHPSNTLILIALGPTNHFSGTLFYGPQMPELPRPASSPRQVIHKAPLTKQHEFRGQYTQSLFLRRTGTGHSITKLLPGSGVGCSAINPKPLRRAIHPVGLKELGRRVASCG